jgi:phosphoglucomutase
MNDILRQALHEKKLNKRAYDEICKWLTEAEFEEFVPELQRLIEANEWNTLMDQFYRTVIFGTAGIRGVMDIGTNRINNYTIRWASQSFAQYLLKYKPDIAGAGVAIAYDSRFHSEEFMQETARVLAANGIPVYIFKYYRATPELSFTVRHLKLAGGIVITASHNPPIFSGYKAYDEHGIQLLPETGQMVEEQFNAVTSIKKMSFDDAVAQNMVRYIGDNVDRAFAEAAKKVSVYPGRDVEIVFSPLHGVGSQSVLPILRELGFNNIHLVEEQMSLDGAFPEVEGYFPNPERAEVYQKPIKLAKSKR